MIQSKIFISVLIFQASYAMSGFLTLSLINNFLNQNVMLENFIRLRMPNRDPSSSGDAMIVSADMPPSYDELFRLKAENIQPEQQLDQPPEYTANKV